VIEPLALPLQTTVSALEAALLAFVLGCAVIAAVLRDVLGVIIAAAAYSLGVAVIWVVLRAPDLLTIAKTVNPTDERSLELPSVGSGAALLAFVLVLGSTVPAMPAIGGSPVTDGEVSQYYLEHAHEQTEVDNVVTAVLAAYRGFDTLGEAVVVFSAGVAVLVVLQREVFV